jgi:hypothetical protein
MQGKRFGAVYNFPSAEARFTLAKITLNKAIKNRTTKNVVLDLQQVARLLWRS